MKFLKHYFRCDHRMNRKPYVLINLVVWLIVLGIASFMTFHAIINASDIHKLQQQLKDGKATEAEIKERQNIALETETKNVKSLSYTVMPILFLLAIFIIPSIAMRLKDLNFSPYWAFFFFSDLIFLIPSLLPDLGKTVHEFISVHMIGLSSTLFGIMFILGAIKWIATLLLLVVRGTKGPNRYGPDPLELKAV